jgi:NADPH-dependent glutamate synthase beta subunit-like oxidoreductase/dihydroorotate dehydrogenase/ferredoxin
LPDLKVEFCGLSLSSPVIVGSAGITRSPEMMQRAEEMGAGAVVAKGFSDLPVMRRSPSPRYTILRRQAGPLLADTFYSYEQASEHDAESYAEMLAEAKRRLSIPVVANVDCQDVESFVKNCQVIVQSGCDALEINVSCPHGSIAFTGQQVEERIIEVAREARRVVEKPLIVKLPPQLTSPVNLVAALARTGIEGVTLFNRFLGLEVDVDEGRPVMHGGFAGHGGLWMHNFVLRWVATIAPQTTLEISASGGTATGRDAAALIMAGAHAVQVCSAIYLRGWEVLRRINRELSEVLDRLGLATVRELRGRLHGQVLDLNEIDRSKRFVAKVNTRGVAPCRAQCPLQEDVQGYLNLIAEGKYEQALALIVANHPFAHTLGRCCHRPCEQACVRRRVDEALSIREAKRFAADYGEMYGRVSAPRAALRAERVAVIGAGPAGLTAAYRLALLGYSVTVFEKLPLAGGMLVAGIPSYRLPRHALDRDLERIWEAGVELRTGVALGADFTLNDLQAEGYRAVIVACGAHAQRRLGIPGENLDGVLEGIRFLRDYNLETCVPSLGDTVAVIGGGDVAIDAARVARRLGAIVRILYRRRLQDMPARQEDLQDAIEEGVEIIEHVQPLEICKKDSGGLEVVCAKTVSGPAASDGRATFTVLEDEQVSFRADRVIVAVGQKLDTSWLSPAGLGELAANGRIQADPLTGVTRRRGIFACGDAVTGPGPLVEAVAAGKRVALAVDAWLRGGQPTARLYDLALTVVEPAEAISAAGGEQIILTRRQMPRRLPIDNRLAGPDEVNLGLWPHHAEAEAARCLSCGGCGGCGDCIRICPYLAIARTQAVEVNGDACDGCGLCEVLCRQRAVEMRKREA